MKKILLQISAPALLTTLLSVPAKVNALTLLSVSEDFTNLQVSYFWNGQRSDASSVTIPPFEWWRVDASPIGPENAVGNPLFQVAHRAAPFSVNDEYQPISYALSPDVQYPATVTQKAICQGISNPSEFCTDTFTFEFQPTDTKNTWAGGVFNITGERVSNVPEPLSIAGSGIAILIGAVLKRKNKAITS